MEDYEKENPISANIRFSWKKPDKTNGEIVLTLSSYQRIHRKNDKDSFLSPEDVFIGNLDLIPLWNSYSGDYPTDAEKEELELKFKEMIKNLMVDAVKRQNEIAMSALSLNEEGSKALYSNLRAGFVFYDLIDFDSIKDSNIVSKIRFLLLGLSKLEAIDLLEDCIKELKKE